MRLVYANEEQILEKLALVYDAPNVLHRQVQEESNHHEWDQAGLNESASTSRENSTESVSDDQRRSIDPQHWIRLEVNSQLEVLTQQLWILESDIEQELDRSRVWDVLESSRLVSVSEVSAIATPHFMSELRMELI